MQIGTKEIQDGACCSRNHKSLWGQAASCEHLVSLHFVFVSSNSTARTATTNSCLSSSSTIMRSFAGISSSLLSFESSLSLFMLNSLFCIWSVESMQAGECYYSRRHHQ